MEATKNDLSYDQTKLDYQAMLATSRIAYARCVEEIGRHLSDMRQPKPKFLPYLSAQWLARGANQLVIAAETMATLEGGLTRSQLEVVNKPEVKGEADDSS